MGAILTRGGLMIAKLGQLDWVPRVPRHLVKHYSECVCESVQGVIIIRMAGLRKADCSPSVGGPHSISWGHER